MSVGGGLGGEEAGGGDCFPLISWVETEQLDLCVEIFTRRGRVMVGTQESEWEGNRFSPYRFLYLSMASLSMHIIYCKNKIHKPQIEFCGL